MKKKTLFLVLISILIIAIVVLILIYLNNSINGNNSQYFYYDQNRNSMYDAIFPIYSITNSGEVRISHTGSSSDESYVKQLDNTQIKELEEDLNVLERLLEQINNDQSTKNSYIVVNGKKFEYVTLDVKNKIDEIVEKYITSN